MKHDRWRKTSACLLVLLFVRASPIPALSGTPQHSSPIPKEGAASSNHSFDSTITLLMRIGRIPSLSACIIKNNTMAWSHGYGFYDRLLRKKPDNSTIYMIGSISKTITTAALMQLYEKGYFTLDENVSKFLPFDLKNPQYPTTNITFRMLLAHQSSLHDHDESSELKYLFSNHPLTYLKELLTPTGSDYHPEYWAAYPPGKEANYSNLGFILLGYILERMTNQTLEHYCQQHIFTPLDMKNTSFTLDGLNRSHLAVPYINILGGDVRIPHTDFSFLDPAGGIYSTTEDLSHLLMMHMNGGVYNGTRILNASTIALMHTVQYPNSSIYIIYRFGLGWLIIPNDHGASYQGHDGDVICFHAKMRICDNGNGIIFFYNVGTLVSIHEIMHITLTRLTYLLYEKARNT